MGRHSCHTPRLYLPQLITKRKKEGKGRDISFLSKAKAPFLSGSPMLFLPSCLFLCQHLGLSANLTAGTHLFTHHGRGGLEGGCCYPLPSFPLPSSEDTPLYGRELPSACHRILQEGEGDPLLLLHLEARNPKLSSWVRSCVDPPPALAEATPHVHHLEEPTEAESKT